MKNKKFRIIISVLTVIFCVGTLAVFAEKSASSSGKKSTAPHARKDARVKINILKMSDKELVDYLLSEVPEANKKVKVMGMTALVTGETLDLRDEHCRYVCLGTNHKENFVREIHYYISASGKIYEYDPIGDGYNIVNEK